MKLWRGWRSVNAKLGCFVATTAGLRALVANVGYSIVGARVLSLCNECGSPGSSGVLGDFIN